MVEPQFSKLMARVRFPSSPPHNSLAIAKRMPPPDRALSARLTPGPLHRLGRARQAREAVEPPRIAVTPSRRHAVTHRCYAVTHRCHAVTHRCHAVTPSRIVVLHGLDCVAAVVATVTPCRRLFGADGPIVSAGSSPPPDRCGCRRDVLRGHQRPDRRVHRRAVQCRLTA